MRYSLFFVLAPVASVLAAPAPAAANVVSAGVPKTGPLCCTSNGVADDSGTCKAAGLNSFACESFAQNDELPGSTDTNDKKGCDRDVVNSAFPVGRTVRAFVANSTDTLNVGPDANGRTFTAWIGCA
ncbi:hypothetical protein LZ32DRAFT_684591 [Colletotrichum eremochloae]|nr:hypothetical protein LZ32DRAFT_684591 [Colletotrichum eremochloae]